MRGEISCTHTNCSLEANKRQTIANGSFDSPPLNLFIKTGYEHFGVGLQNKEKLCFGFQLKRKVQKSRNLIRSVRVNWKEIKSLNNLLNSVSNE